MWPKNLARFLTIPFLGCCSTTVFSHSQTVVFCGSCSTVLCTPTGGRARLTEGEWATDKTSGGIHAVGSSYGYSIDVQPFMQRFCVNMEAAVAETKQVPLPRLGSMMGLPFEGWRFCCCWVLAHAEQLERCHGLTWLEGLVAMHNCSRGLC
jgi:ribosomal protein S27E